MGCVPKSPDLARAFERKIAVTTMQTLDDFDRFKFYGDSLGGSSSVSSDRPTVAFLRHRLHALYETPVEDLPEAFRQLLAELSHTFGDKA